MDNHSYKDVYDKILTNYDQYLKTIEICHNLSSIRMNNLIKAFV